MGAKIGGEREREDDEEVLCLNGTNLKVGDFVWAENERPAPCSDGSPPDIDLSLSDEELIPLLHSAAASWGFFRIFNHGVPESLFTSLSAHGIRFFELALSDKLPVTRKPPLSLMGYIGMADSAVYKAWCEALHVMPEEDDISAFLNQVPSLVDERASFRTDVAEYFSVVGALAARILHLLFCGVGLDEAEAKVVSDNVHCATMRINYYPVCPIPNLTYGSPPHKDYGGLTILHQDDVGGLEILKDNKWVAVKPEKGYLVVNVGDLLQILSNGIYKSVWHRSLVHSSKGRLSLAFFSFPEEESVIEPVLKLVTKDCPAKYKSFHMKEYRSLFPKAQRSKIHSPSTFLEIQQSFV